MSGPIAIDTPDYQRGVVSAQVQLGTIAAGNLEISTGVPPNTETLVVLAQANSGPNPATVVGNSSSVGYPGKSVTQTVGGETWTTTFIDVSTVVDQAVTVTISYATGVKSWVYSDAGAHIMLDVSQASNQKGQQYVIPSIPSTIATDHPPTEVQWKSVATAVNATLLPAPGAGLRYRVFAAQIDTGATLSGFLEDNVSGAAFIVCGANQACSLNFPAQGMPLSTNSAVTFVIYAGAGTALCNVIYTLENV